MQAAHLEKRVDKRLMRKSGVDLLRIVAMIAIVAHHFSLHSGFDFAADTITFNRLWVQLIQVGGKVGVNVFILISGYFLSGSRTIKTDKLLKLWLQILFYSVGLYGAFVAAGAEPLSKLELVKRCAPVTFNQWWFATNYFMLYLLSPYINRLLRVFDKVQYVHYLTLLTICWSVVPTFTDEFLGSNNLLWFAYLYSLGGYYKIYGSRRKLPSWRLITIGVLLIGLMFLSAVVFDLADILNPELKMKPTILYDMQKLPSLLAAILLFLGFSQLKFGYGRLLGALSSATFGVYLIHDNRLVRPFLWKTVFHNASLTDSPALMFYSVLVIGIVYLGCSIIELLRLRILEDNYMPALKRLSDYMDEKKVEFLHRRDAEQGNTQ